MDPQNSPACLRGKLVVAPLQQTSNQRGCKRIARGHGHLDRSRMPPLALPSSSPRCADTAKAADYARHQYSTAEEHEARRRDVRARGTGVFVRRSWQVVERQRGRRLARQAAHARTEDLRKGGRVGRARKVLGEVWEEICGGLAVGLDVGRCIHCFGEVPLWRRADFGAALAALGHLGISVHLEGPEVGTER
eukprot:scaffold55797_cov31-Tisochrysis_lutea.AAC.3